MSESHLPKGWHFFWEILTSVRGVLLLISAVSLGALVQGERFQGRLESVEAAESRTEDRVNQIDAAQASQTRKIDWLLCEVGRPGPAVQRLLDVSCADSQPREDGT